MCCPVWCYAAQQGHRGVDTTPLADRNVSGSDHSGVMDSWAWEVGRALLHSLNTEPISRIFVKVK